MVWLGLCLPWAAPALSQEPPIRQSREAEKPLQRIPRQKALQTAALDGVVREKPVAPGAPVRPVAGARIALRNLDTGEVHTATANAEGVFRLLLLPPGRYELRVEADGYSPLVQPEVRLAANELVTLEIALVPSAAAVGRSRLPREPELGPPLPDESQPSVTSYRELRRRLDSNPDYVESAAAEPLPPASDVFREMSDRWHVPMPDYRRYPQKGEYPYVKSRWWDPFNRNRLKGDYPIWPEVLGKQTFLNLTATAETFFDGRRVPSPSNVSSARPGSEEFFGKGEQAFVDQSLRFSFDLFHGDTAFRPVDWRIRFTPELSLNDLAVRERGIVNPDVRRGTNRFDVHLGVQEALVEVKLRDLSVNYDFLSVRAGIQQFSSDFRGFLLVEEQPGVRFFGNLHSNRWEYNLAYFHFLEKDTNSGLNRFERRHQQVLVGNIYLQDFFFPGYTAQFSLHYNKDDPTIHFDENDFIVRPAPIGLVQPHGIRVGYLGWTGNGHVGRFNLSHAFYQAVGEDSLNPIAGRPVTVNAQMAAAEVSLDRDWARYRVSFFYSSGDANPRDARARGFDSIVDLPAFAGGIFSFWSREGIRLTGSGVLLTPPGSLLPSLRSNKEEGQANFVNPGIFLANAGADFEITPKLRGFANVNYLRFARTDPLELLLFQAPIRHGIGVDYGVGAQYRPPLTENIVIIGGASALSPGQGFKDIYTGKTLFSLFGVVRFTF
jgi:hypothetical protein